MLTSLEADLEARDSEIRSAAKWILAASAGVATFVLGGAGSVNLQNLRVGDPSWLLFATIAVALTAAAVVLLKASRVLIAPHVTLADLAERELVALTKAVSQGAGRRDASRVAPELDWLLGVVKQNLFLLIRSGEKSPKELYDAYVLPDHDDNIDADVARVTAFATHKLVLKRYSSLLRWLLGAAVAIATALFLYLFATSSNTDLLVTEPVVVNVTLRDDAEAMKTAGVAQQCAGKTVEGVALGGTWDSPQVVSSGSASCVGFRTVVSTDVGLAVPVMDT